MWQRNFAIALKISTASVLAGSPTMSVGGVWSAPQKQPSAADFSFFAALAAPLLAAMEAAAAADAPSQRDDEDGPTRKKRRKLRVVAVAEQAASPSASGGSWAQLAWWANLQTRQSKATQSNPHP